jgi:gamma-glutamyltranspeptidase/glutathione hydrolase
LFTTRPELSGDFGMVASTHWLASATGMGVLERGGNAFDAAVAAGFVLQVAEPHLNGPGGEVPILLWSEAEQKVSVVCGQGVAPAAATIERFAELGLDVVPGTGLLAATVPGAFGGWMLMLERWGTWSLADVLAPAIHYAEHGVPVLERISATIGSVEELFRQDWPTSAATWLPDGNVPKPGSKLANPVLAATYRRLVAEAEAASSTREGQLAAARKAWYEGFVAEAIAGFSATTAWRDSSGEVHGGLLTGDDLAGWSASVEEPLTFDYQGCTVAKTGPWGQGPAFLQQLALLDGFDLDGMDFLGADYLHTVTEAAKLAFADREAWYGDTDVPMADLLSPAYNAERRRLIGAEASLELRPGAPGGRAPSSPTPARPATRPACPAPASRRGSASRRCRVTAWSRATPATWTSWTASATWCRPPPAAAGCRAPPPSPSWASAWARGPRCSGCRRAWPPRCGPAPARVRRCRRRSRSGTASRGWRSAPRAATSRTSGA